MAFIRADMKPFLKRNAGEGVCHPPEDMVYKAKLKAVPPFIEFHFYL